MQKTNNVVGRKGQHGRNRKYSKTFKILVARQYLEGDLSLNQVGAQHNVAKSYVSQWVKQFSSELADEPIISAMTEQEQKDLKALQKQMKALEKKLEYEQMRNFALETMVDLAKEQMGIDLRKNFGAKQPKE